MRAWLGMNTALFGRMVHFLIGLFLFSFNAKAEINGYHMTWPDDVEAYFSQIESRFTETQASCSPLLDGLYKKSKIEMRYALGYFDESYGAGFVHPEYGYSYSLDPIAYQVIRNFLKKPCPFNSDRQACGFYEVPPFLNAVSRLEKVVSRHGFSQTFSIQLSHSSASIYFLPNTNENKYEQAEVTALSESNFLNGLAGEADIIFYNGHSRDGGGPDFSPPVLRASDLKVNYAGFYHLQKPGYKKMMSSLRLSGAKPQVIGLFSCYSKKHFYRPMTLVGPQKGLILTGAAIDYLNTTLASLGYLEALLRGACGNDIRSIVNQNYWIENKFSEYNMN